MFDCLINVQSSDVAVCLRSEMPLGALIMTYSMPMLQATCEVILLFLSSIKLQQMFDLWGEPNPGPYSRKLSAITARLTLIQWYPDNSMYHLKLNIRTWNIRILSVQLLNHVSGYHVFGFQVPGYQASGYWVSGYWVSGY